MGKKLKMEKRFVLLMETLGLTKNSKSGRNVMKRLEIIKENLKKYVASKNKMKKLNAREQEMQMNCFLYAIS